MNKQLIRFEAYTKLWETIKKQVPLLQFMKGVHFIAIPLLNLAYLIHSSKGIYFGQKGWWFIAWYIPYAMIIAISYMIADRDIKQNRGKKVDWALLIYWVNNGIALILLAIPFQAISFLYVERGLTLPEGEKATILYSFLFIDLIIVFYFLTIQKNNYLLGSGVGGIKKEISRISFNPKTFTFGVVLGLVMAIIILVISGFKDFEVLIISVFSFITSLLCLILGFLGLQQFYLLIKWRKQNFWDN